MKVDLSTPINDFDGTQLKDESDKPLTLGRVCVVSLSTPLEDDRGLTPEKVVERWHLANRLYIYREGKEVELSPEEAATIRSRIPKCFILKAAGPAIDLLKG